MESKKHSTQPMKKENGLQSKDVKARVKEFAGIRRAIKKALESDEKTIPQIAEETGMPPAAVTYYLMTMLKYGDVSAGEMDEDDAYYFYRLKREK